MKNVTRALLTFLSLLSSFYFIYRFPFSLIPQSYAPQAVKLVVSILLALAIGFYMWKKTEKISNGLATHIILGGIIIGSIGFILGFFGPIIFSPDSNQGPLLGIFITGPLGFLMGLVGGGIYWLIRVKYKNGK